MSTRTQPGAGTRKSTALPARSMPAMSVSPAGVRPASGSATTPRASSVCTNTWVQSGSAVVGRQSRSTMAESMWLAPALATARVGPTPTARPSSNRCSTPSPPATPCVSPGRSTSSRCSSSICWCRGSNRPRSRSARAQERHAGHEGHEGLKIRAARCREDRDFSLCSKCKTTCARIKHR